LACPNHHEKTSSIFSNPPFQPVEGESGWRRRTGTAHRDLPGRGDLGDVGKVAADEERILRREVANYGKE
jgi:hypothetical protein